MIMDKEYIAQLTLFEISGKIGEEEKALLHKLIGENEEYYALYTELYAEFPETELIPARENTGPVKIWTDIRKKTRSNSIRRTILAVAALFVIIIGTGLYMFLNRQKHTVGNTLAKSTDHITLEFADGKNVDLSKDQGQVQAGGTVLNNNNNQLTYADNHQNDQLATLIVPPGKNYMIRLTDGTEVYLNAETRLEFALSFTGSTREIVINGEAYIKVTKNADKPFLVHLPGSTVHVLGTEFNVNTYDSGIVKVALVTGAVNIKHNEDSTIIKPGFELSVNESAGPIVEKFDADDVLAWRKGLHLFNAASLQEVAKLIHRSYGINVQVDANVGQKKPFTGSLNLNKPIQNFLEGLKFLGYLNYRFDKDSTLHIN